MNSPASAFLSMMLAALASAALFYILREHWAHVFGLLPYLLFLVCPAMHYFVHGRHQHGKRN
jgi:hypothetical protein